MHVHTLPLPRLALRCVTTPAPPPPSPVIDPNTHAVDIALPGERIAVEVDGPHHFTANTFKPMGEMYCR